jgi:hypothetical protein
MQLNNFFPIHALIFLMSTGAAFNVALGQQNAPAAGPGQAGGQGGQRAAGPPPLPPPMRLVSTDVADGNPIAGKLLALQERTPFHRRCNGCRRREARKVSL